jgi:hypothetical protein
MEAGVEIGVAGDLLDEFLCDFFLVELAVTIEDVVL